MKRQSTIMAIILAVILSGSAIAATPTGTKYMLTDTFGGNWADAEKSPTNSEDDDMCWAAAASNVLQWTGWGNVGGLNGSDSVFSYFQNHWTDAGSLPMFGWEWFFSGNNTSLGWANWAQVDVSGGGFYPTEDYWRDLLYDNYRAGAWDTSGTMGYVDRYLRAGYGTTLAVYSSTIAHAITVWGFNYNPVNVHDYYGVWITDSDDNKGSITPKDELKYVAVKYQDSKWYLQDYYGYNDIYINYVEALAPMPVSGSPVPEPGTILAALSILGPAGMIFRRRKA